MTTPITQHIVRSLTDGDLPRVWSLLVTVFGDLAQEKGRKISGVALGHMAEAIGLKPEAVRVAMHRLRKDGWIESHKEGRERHHCLTDWGLAQCVHASPRIYGTPAQNARVWLHVYERGSAPATGHDIVLNTTSRLSADPGDPAGAFVTEINPDTALPDWMRNKVCPADVVQTARIFANRLTDCAAFLKDHPDLGPLDVAVLRILIVHGWRRIVLKTPDLPDYVFPKDWDGPTCRARVAALLAQYPRVDTQMIAKPT